MTMCLRLCVATGCLAALGVLAGEREVSAQDPVVSAPARYDGIIAGWESYMRGETARRQDIGVQLGLNDTMAWYAGAPTFTPYPPDLESVYASYPTRAYRGPTPGLTYAHRGYPGVFEPRPLVPGDIWGFPWLKRVVQPRGHVTTPTGPNSYIYGPVYDDPKPAQPAPAGPGPTGPRPGSPPLAEAPAMELPAVPPPPIEAPVEVAPEKPAPEAIPAPEPEINGPREF